MDSVLIPDGATRCSLWKFILGLSAAGLVVAVGAYAMLECWIRGLNVTGMNDYYGFALWIWADLAVIALGGGAFFSGPYSKHTAMQRFNFSIQSHLVTLYMPTWGTLPWG